MNGLSGVGLVGLRGESRKWALLRNLNPPLVPALLCSLLFQALIFRSVRQGVFFANPSLDFPHFPGILTSPAQLSLILAEHELALHEMDKKQSISAFHLLSFPQFS